METTFPPNWGTKRPKIRYHAESAGKLPKPKGRLCLCLSKSAIFARPRPMKYSMAAARLFPIQETSTPTKGPKMAPFKITIGSVGIGVADKTPINKMESNGPAIPVVGITFSIALKSFLK